MSDLEHWRNAAHFWREQSFHWRKDGERARVLSFATGFVAGTLVTLWINAFVGG